MRLAFLPALILVATSALAGGVPVLQVEMPAKAFDRQSRDAALLVRASRCGAALTTAVSGRAEGIVHGERRTVPLTLRVTSQAGTSAVSRADLGTVPDLKSAAVRSCCWRASSAAARAASRSRLATSSWVSAVERSSSSMTSPRRTRAPSRRGMAATRPARSAPTRARNRALTEPAWLLVTAAIVWPH